jgi:hypothetical protein
MNSINAETIGQVINNPNAPVIIINNFGEIKEIPSPSNISSPKGFVGREFELKDLHKLYAEGNRTFVLHGHESLSKKSKLIIKHLSKLIWTA